MVQHAFTGLNGRPGISQVVETFENEFLWGHFPHQQFTGLLIDRNARDVGNTNSPEILRQGLLLGKVEATQTLMQWNPNATDGSEYIWGVLNQTVSMRALIGTQDRLNGYIVYAGGLLSDRIIIPGSTEPGIVGNALEYQVRALLRANFELNDSYQYSRPNGFISNVTAAQVAQAGGTLPISLIDSGKEFHAAFDYTTVLPPIPVRGVTYQFFNNGSTTTIQSASTNILVPGTPLANTLATTDEVIELVGTGTAWLVK